MPDSAPSTRPMVWDITVDALESDEYIALVRDQDVGLADMEQSGRVVLDGGCLALDEDEGDSPAVIVWPSGTEAEGAGVVVAGSPFAEGDRLSGGGQEVDATVIEESFDGDSLCDSNAYVVLQDLRHEDTEPSPG